MPAEESAPDSFDLECSLRAPAMPAHLYIHVPFCRSKCSYCDFYSITGATDDLTEVYRRGVEAELVRWADAALPGLLDSVYVGGGTPSAFAHLPELLDAVMRRFDLHPTAEVTIEANPGTVTPALLKRLARAGVTRVSLGVQTLAAGELALLGRTHTREQVLEACSQVLDAGLDLSVDLMCGIPGQMLNSWISTLEAVIDAGARHVSVYPLSLEEGTPLAVACEGGLVPEPDSDLAASMMLAAEEVLTAAGLPRYEVANYAVPGHESRHNLAYWTGRNYIGIGPSAHSMFDAQTARAVGLLPLHSGGSVARVRIAEPADIDEWLTSGEVETEYLDADQVAREDIMLGLRLTRGVAESQVEAAALTAVLESLAGQGLVELVESHWRTTRRGWLLGNEVFGRVWAGE
ncbi:MAG: coproporphyrinogen III oxidase [Actinobacteria bacterium HGW-Actinobacteria-10]|jgi:oxygen-independent coproporphyrinogen-3 oxidase|nr:MAG: coproporphyrinogen III oxidase [Actinobacteria bacterium HGW-Actinobacteria-10]